MNRAVQGDVVAVEVFDEKEWMAPADEVVDQDATLKNDDADDSGEEEEAVIDAESKMVSTSSSSSNKQPTGRIVGVIKRNWRA